MNHAQLRRLAAFTATLTCVAALGPAERALAQDESRSVRSAGRDSASQPSAPHRSDTGRARMEIGFDHGYGFGSEGDYAELAADVRVYSPEGFGGVLRLGAAMQGLSNAPAVDLGLAYRGIVALGARDDISLSLALGMSLTYGPFLDGQVLGLGGFGVAHVDYWHDHVFLGLGVSAHVVELEPSFARGLQDRRRDPIVTVTPMLRVGGEWGL